MLTGIGVTLLAIAVAGAAVKIHDFFEGETLLHDVADELALSRVSLADLDEAWARNPRRCDAVISLTSIPSRLPQIEPTLKSLLRQEVAPRQIVLNLPLFSKREGVAYEVPAFLDGIRAVTVRRCEDMGPATKLLPTLAAEDPHTPIIVLDDDRIYPANLVADLVAAADRDAVTAFCMSGWVVPPDLVDRPTTVWSNLRMLAPAPIRARRLSKPVEIDILQGLSGYLVRPEFFDLAAVADYSGAPREAFFVDDVWISAHCRARRFVIPSRRGNYQPKLRRGHYRRTSLGRINRGPGPDAQRSNSIVLRHFPRRWLTTASIGADVK